MNHEPPPTSEVPHPRLSTIRLSELSSTQSTALLTLLACNKAARATRAAQLATKVKAA